jgi:hypothetical protein
VWPLSEGKQKKEIIQPTREWWAKMKEAQKKIDEKINSKRKK